MFGTDGDQGDCLEPRAYGLGLRGGIFRSGSTDGGLVIDATPFDHARGDPGDLGFRTDRQSP